MTIEQFNALPEEARRYIESQKGCLSCGKTLNLDLHYQNYLTMKNENFYTLRRGAVNFVEEKTKKGGILYPLEASDNEDQIKAKLKTALKIHAARPEMFSAINKEAINEKLGLVKTPAKKEKDLAKKEVLEDTTEDKE